MPHIRPHVVALIVFAVTLLGGAAIFVNKSNLALDEGSASYEADERERSWLVITGPAGWNCIAYATVVNEVEGSAEEQFASGGVTECPLFGGVRALELAWNGQGTHGVPLDELTEVHRSPSGTYALYVWITEREDAWDSVRTRR